MKMEKKEFDFLRLKEGKEKGSYGEEGEKREKVEGRGGIQPFKDEKNGKKMENREKKE